MINPTHSPAWNMLSLPPKERWRDCWLWSEPSICYLADFPYLGLLKGQSSQSHVWAPTVGLSPACGSAFQYLSPLLYLFVCVFLVHHSQPWEHPGCPEAVPHPDSRALPGLKMHQSLETSGPYCSLQSGRSWPENAVCCALPIHEIHGVVCVWSKIGVCWNLKREKGKKMKQRIFT